MKKYRKAQLLAKNLPYGAYSAGCPMHSVGKIGSYAMDRDGQIVIYSCQQCEIVG